MLALPPRRILRAQRRRGDDCAARAAIEAAALGSTEKAAATLASLRSYIANPKPLTTWLRKDFAVADAPAAIASVNYNDGFIAYLNGTEVARRSLPASVTASTPATPHMHGTFETLDLTAFKNLLAPGRNVLAIELRLASITDTDAYFDADGDGFDALREYLAGTDPHDPASRPRISSVSAIAGGYRIAFPTATGRTYRVEWSPDLAQWFTLADNIAGTGKNVTIDDLTVPPPQQRLYRVVIRP